MSTFKATIEVVINTEPDGIGLYEVSALSGDAIVGNWSKGFLEALGAEFPKPIQVGETVTWDDENNHNHYSGYEEFTVLAIDEGVAFLKSLEEPVIYCTWAISTLKRVP